MAFPHHLPRLLLSNLALVRAQSTEEGGAVVPLCPLESLLHEGMLKPLFQIVTKIALFTLRLVMQSAQGCVGCLR